MICGPADDLFFFFANFAVKICQLSPSITLAIVSNIIKKVFGVIQILLF